MGLCLLPPSAHSVLYCIPSLAGQGPRGEGGRKKKCRVKSRFPCLCLFLSGDGTGLELLYCFNIFSKAYQGYYCKRMSQNKTVFSILLFSFTINNN